MHRPSPQPAGLILAPRLDPLLPRLARQPVPAHFAQAAARVVHIVEVLAFGIDEIPEGPFGGHAPTEHGFRAVESGLPQHVVHPRAQAGVHQAVAPVQGLIIIGDGDDRHGAVHVLARFHGLHALGRMEPRLGDDDQGVKIGPADVVQRVIGVARVELVLPRLKLCKPGDALRLPVAQGDAVHRRVALEKFREGCPEAAQSHESDADAHVFSFSAELSVCFPSGRSRSFDGIALTWGLAQVSPMGHALDQERECPEE